MGTNAKRWLVDATLAVGYLVAMEIDLTGIAGHEWLGLGVTALAGYHLLTHRSWVATVTRRLFGRTSAQARRYYVLDAALLVGFLTIGVTGLAISTWLSLPLASYLDWRDVHVAASVITLGVIALKVALHWRWVLTMAPRVMFGPATANDGPAMPSSAGASRLGRRHFAAFAGATGALALLSGGRALAGTILAPAAPASADKPTASAAIGPMATTVAVASSHSSATGAKPTATTATNRARSATDSPTSGGGSESCIYRCPRGLHCSYPGRCRRYADANANRRCDLGECA